MNKPIVLASPIGNARERYEAMQKGKSVPPRQTIRRDLPEAVLDTFLERLAAVLAEEYRREVGDST